MAETSVHFSSRPVPSRRRPQELEKLPQATCSSRPPTSPFWGPVNDSELTRARTATSVGKFQHSRGFVCRAEVKSLESSELRRTPEGPDRVQLRVRLFWNCASPTLPEFDTTYLKRGCLSRARFYQVGFQNPNLSTSSSSLLLRRAQLDSRARSFGGIVVLWEGGKIVL